MRKQEADARPAVPPCAPIARGRPSCSPAPSGPVVEESSSPASRPSLCFPCRGGVLLCAGAAQPHVSFRRCDAHGRRCAPPYSTPTFARPSAARRDAARLELRVPVRVDLLLPSASSGLRPCRAPLLASRSCSIEQQSCSCPVRGTIRLRQAGTLATSAASSPRGGVSVNDSRLVGSLCCRSFAEMTEICMCCKSFAD
ncbi:uncharacterized protein LOC100272902 [Zea mays]|jgi:hypothetical protein|uniref:Uncharacterized protein n=1 Tax=Zea mays TaxID=4577 RepID=B4FRJ5_MAIZE|nr:uncharacterized protein LOC100272902 [Zea mays]ACF84738.1 unknown [Zea mays]|eukprot:NP_001140827.1 uncharacterized protein LOC100272902 [Zea mays]